MPATWKPRRIWRWARIGGFVGAAIFGLTWPLTFIGGITMALSGGVRVAVYGGSFNVQYLAINAQEPAAAFAYPRAPGATWWLPRFNAINVGGPGAGLTQVEAIVPLWLLALVCAGVGVSGALGCRRPLVGACRRCRYDLSGLPPGSVCPECGRQ